MNGTQQDNTPYAYGHETRPAGEDLPQGRPTAVTVPPVRKSPALATLLSCMPGLGQVYVGYYQQGFLCVVAVATTIMILKSPAMRAWYPFFGVFLAFFWIFNMIDANRRAMHYNRVAAGLGGEEIPEGFALPGTGGSVAGGVILVVLGLMLFLNVKFGVSMAWLEDWWPLALVGGGIWLIVQARRERD